VNELDKLKHLLHHWAEHNDEHAETYRDWAARASALGNRDLAAVLERLFEESTKLKRLFEEAGKKIG